jgi:hypothetical protein
VLNELQSSNVSTIQDDLDEFDDWFEIYNPNSFSVDLAGYYVTDDPMNPLKDRIPVGSSETVIEPFGFLLFWADEQGEQGPRHVNFKLSGMGESLNLTAPDGTTPIDGIDFGPIPTDDSFGRFCDGQDIWMGFTVPSPGYGNCVNGLEEFGEKISIYPNPVAVNLHLPERGEFEVFDSSGRLILTGRDSQIDVSGLDNGIYHLLFNKSGVARFIKR